MDEDVPAKLSVVFFGSVPKTPNYWIMDLGPLNDDGLYSYALVGNALRESLYILNREPTMDNATLTYVLDWLENKAGYNTDKLKYTTQEGCTYH